MDMFYIWSVSCLVGVVDIVHQLKRISILSKLVQIIFYALKVTYPFLFVILISFLIFAMIGMSIFGGSINSRTPALYLKYVGGELNDNYEYLNWNDLVNSLVFVYSIVINNSIPTLLNMCIVDRGYATDFRGLYFLAF